jgi:hypothetical protein
MSRVGESGGARVNITQGVDECFGARCQFFLLVWITSSVDCLLYDGVGQVLIVVVESRHDPGTLNVT